MMMVISPPPPHPGGDGEESLLDLGVGLVPLLDGVVQQLAHVVLLQLPARPARVLPG
jgi:hypothetical protein